MAFDNTVNEQDLDPAAQQLVQDLRTDNHDFEPDLAVDGLSDSVLSRFLGLFGLGRSRH